ncbi:MAG: hypothetical protein ACOYEL_05045, partial [Saccharofermentanales bacterium]
EDCFEINRVHKSLDDLMSLDFYRYSNSVADNYYTGHIFDNILFSNMVQKILAIEYYLKNNCVSEIQIEATKSNIARFTIDAASRIGIKINPRINRKQYPLMKCYFKADGATIYLLAKQLKNKYVKRQLDYNNDFSVIRTSAAKGKIKQTDNRELFYEDVIGVGDFYSFFSLKIRRYYLRKANIEAKNDLKELRECLANWGFVHSTPYILDFFSCRLVAAKFYQLLIRELFALPWNGRFLSGNNLDLYALAEESEAKNAGIDTVCIPHGIEYGFKFPHCFTGDVFYTYSQNAADYLNSLYRESKFVFDKELVEDIFKSKKKIEGLTPKIVYFSEPREPEVNLQIIRSLLECLWDVKLYIKHHPKDNLDGYNEFAGKIEVIDDLNVAIQGNVCLSRKSTTLLEGVYNGSKCGAIITNEKDRAIFYNFPSLQDEGIKVFTSITEAAKWAEKIIKQE